MRRRQPPEPHPDVPGWVREFTYADWADQSVPVPDWWEDSAAFWHYLTARRRWSDACEAWASGRQGVDLFALHYPETAANLQAAGLMPASSSARPRQ